MRGFEASCSVYEEVARRGSQPCAPPGGGRAAYVAERRRCGARARCCAAALGRIRAAAAVCLRACVHASSLLGCLRRSDSGDWGGDNTEQMELHVATRGCFRELFSKDLRETGFLKK
jgi:hypothetical protein